MAILPVLESESTGKGRSRFKPALIDSSRHRSAEAVSRAVSGLALTFIILALWELATAMFKINPYILPSPLAVFSTLVASMGFLKTHLLVTLVETILGFAIAVVVGIGLAMVLAHFRRLREASYPILMLIQTMPKVALAPVLLVWFGYGLLPKLAMTFLAAFFPIFINTMTGLTTIDEELLYLTRILGAKPSQVYRKVRLLNSLPYLFAGCKVGITLAVIGAVVAEFVSAEHGLGFIIVTAQGQFRTDLAFAAIFLLAAMGLVLFYLIEFLERVLTPWQPKEV